MLRDLACEGWVVHRRRTPVEHQFRYPVWMLCLDADGIDRLAASVGWLSSRHRWWPLSLRVADFPRLGPEGRGGSVRHRLNGYLADHAAEPAEQVFLLTQPRSWGWLFNPVSFYFCYRAGRLCHVVAEITNTPWGEIHGYVLDAREREETLEFRFPKSFHVSPYLPMDMDYRWRMNLSGTAIDIVMHVYRQDVEVFSAGLHLRAVPLTDRALRRGAWRYPLQNVRTLMRIYMQALALWWKRAPFHPHPDSTRKVEST